MLDAGAARIHANGMSSHRVQLLQSLARLDQLTAEADTILAESIYPDVGATAEELRDTLVAVRNKIEETLNRNCNDIF
jgi:hypothetical protein